MAVLMQLLACHCGASHVCIHDKVCASVIALVESAVQPIESEWICATRHATALAALKPNSVTDTCSRYTSCVATT